MAQGIAGVAPGKPQRTADFIASLGVDTRIGQAGNAPAQIISNMAYLGLNHIRNAQITTKSAPSAWKNYGLIADAGIRFDWLTGGATGSTKAGLAGDLTALHTFVSLHPGSVTAIEGPNEVNNFPITFDGVGGRPGALGYQGALYAAAKADALLASIPVLNFTDSAVTVGASDALNAHPYPNNGMQPYARLADVVGKQQKQAPGKPVYFTEGGYSTLVGGGHALEGVDETTQAKLTLNFIMDATRLGVSGTWLYDLVDDGADPTNTLTANHFGLFATTGRAKPVATAIHNLTSILRDTGQAATSFTPTPLAYTLNGLPASGSSLLMQTSAGVYDLVVWAEPDIWDEKAHTAIGAPAQSVTLTLGQSFGKVSVFDPLASTQPLQTRANTNTVSLSVTDHPLIVQISTLAQAMASVSSEAAPLTQASVSAPAVTFAPTLTSNAGH